MTTASPTLQRLPRDAVVGELRRAAPLDRPALLHAVLVRRLHVHERVRVAEHELHQLAFEAHLAADVVGGAVRVMRPRRRGRRTARRRERSRARRREPGIALSRSWLLLREAAIHRLDEHLRRPGAGRRAVAAVEIQRRPRRLHLLERLPFASCPARGRESSPACCGTTPRRPCPTGGRGRDDPGAALRAVLGHREIEDLVEAVDDALDAAALLQVDHRIADGREEVAGVITSEWRKNTRLSPSVLAAGRVIDDDRFAVEVLRQLVELVEVGVGRPRGSG